MQEAEIKIGGISVRDLAEQYGTPLYAYDAERIRENFRRLTRALRSCYPEVSVFYAIKACNNLEIAKLLVEQGSGVDAASPNEIRLAQALGLSGEQIIYTGNSLSDEDLAAGLRAGVIFNVDDHGILRRLFALGRPRCMSFRINPSGEDIATPDLKPFAGPSAKFGIHPRYVEDAYRTALENGVERLGVHMMPHSQANKPESFAHVTAKLLDLIGPVARKLGFDLAFLDIGGGLGIPYRREQPALDVDAVAREIAAVVQKKCAEHGMKAPRLVMEPGRYFVGDAGYVLGRVISIKQGYKTIIGTDISMNTMARPVMYGAYHEVRINGRRGKTAPMAMTGQVCENTDMWISERELPADVAEGDVVVLMDAGAYGHVMSYDYNGRLRPAEVLVDGGKSRLIRRRDTFEDMVSRMCLSDDIKERLRTMGVEPAGAAGRG
ncbi:diaminopimelate decarboxylase [Sorangium sp. So ce394]|uniref:Diaminopimelate decarboxylase n=1 Tax=Sorangium cellulosum TaxID=56 RepID=A0A150SG05_SORCE|nr:diaminopimelate decarboxylase [Sorangium cellulosum]KYF91311.1 diaminopimelate decarboxylase [Sorangium cellulosum]